MTCLRALALVVATLAIWPRTGTAAGVPPEVARALRQAHIPINAVALVVEEAGGKARITQRADAPMNPASLTKLITTYAALDLLGPTWTWKTPVWLQGSVKDGVLDGTLVIKGSGDPKLVLERLWLLLRRVQQLGVREIRGDIVLDRSAFAQADSAPGEFDGEVLRPYNVQPDALLLNYKSVVLVFTPDPALAVARVSADPPLLDVAVDATVPLLSGPCADWRAKRSLDFSATRLHFTGGYLASCGEQPWPVAYVDPASFNARAIAAMWRELGGKLSGTVREGLAPPSLAPTFEFASPPLGEVVRDINKFSNNTMAQQLFLTLALTQKGAPATPQAARDTLRQWLADHFGESAATDTSIDNGSGLSRSTRLSAQLLARVLQSAWASPVMPELLASLPLVGLDGTLKQWHASAGRAHLKTGSLRDVLGIAGYVLADNGKHYVVVALVNHPNAAAARPALDAVVQWIVRGDGSRCCGR